MPFEFQTFSLRHFNLPVGRQVVVASIQIWLASLRHFNCWIFTAALASPVTHPIEYWLMMAAAVKNLLRQIIHFFASSYTYRSAGKKYRIIFP
jgi:hypothetical protein